ncbi:MAG: O-antigen ligase family protein [Saprospiraceae bacterium]|nr:O-antigen ligase family protein [Saprospiraceae bacterium]
MLIAFNVLDYLYFWKGAPYAVPTKLTFNLIALYLLPKSVQTPNLSFQIWTIFAVFFIAIAYPVTFIYRELHPTVDAELLIRSFIYNYIVALSCYKFTLFAAQRGHLNRFINGVLILFILSSLLTIFALPLGFLSVRFTHPPNIVPLDRMAGVYLNPNLAGFAGNITMSLGLSVLFRNEGSIGRALLGFLGISIGILAIAASVSKTAIIIAIFVLLLSIVVYCTTYRRISKPTRRLGNVFFGVLIYGVIQMGILLSVFFNHLLPSQQRRIEQIGLILTGRADKSDTSNRAELASYGFEKISDRPLFGTGLGSFMHLIEAANKIGDDVGIHNIYLRVWGEGGILPFCLFLLFWGVSAWQAFQVPVPWLRISALALWVMFFISGLTTHDLLEFNLSGAMIGFMCAFLVVHRFLEDNEDEL